MFVQRRRKDWCYVLMNMISLSKHTSYVIMKSIVNLTIVHCNCEPLAVTLVRAQLWPATPHLPRLVFSFSFFFVGLGRVADGRMSSGTLRLV